MFGKTLAAVTALAACASLQASAQPSGRGDFTIRAAINSDIRSTQPGVNRDFNTDIVIVHVVEGLVAFDEQAGTVPMLAQSVALADDKRTYTFTLREGVRFHNGAPLTSSEVLWSLRRYMDPAVQWRCLPDLDGTSGLAKIVDMKAVDPRTVTVTLAEPAALFLPTLARADCGGTGIVHPASVGPDGAWVKPIGTGPYMMGEWRRGQSVELDRFDGYLSRPGSRDGLAGGKQAEAAKLRFLVIPDSASMKAALVAGNVDVMSDVLSTDLDEMRANKDLELLGASTTGMYAILIQTRDPLLSDRRIRRALVLSLDLPEIVESSAGGDTRPNASPVPVTSAFHGAAQKAVPKRDIAAAKKLLAEAGYKGQPIRMVTNRRYVNNYDVAVAAQAMAAEAGIRIELDVFDWATELDRYTSGDYQLMSFGFTARLDPSLSWDLLVGSKASQPRKVWDDPEAIALVQRSMKVTDQPERQAIFDELERRFADANPAIMLWNTRQYVAVRRNIRGVQPWATGLIRLWGVSRS